MGKKIVSKTYTKTHSSKKALESHLSNLKKRGGLRSIEKNVVAGGTKLTYKFFNKK